MAERWTNNAESTLDAAINGSDTTILVQSGHGARFPSPTHGDYFWLTIENEIVKCTARSTDSLTVVRAQQGTSGASHADDTPVKLLWTAESARFAAFNHIPGRISGRRYLGGVAAFVSTGTVTLNQLIAQPFYIGAPTAWDGIVIACLGDSSAFARLGLYRDDGGKPGALIVDAGQVDCSAGGEKVASIAVTLGGIVWVAYVAQGVTPRVTRCDDTFHPLVGVASAYSTAGALAYSQTGISGALPDPWGATYTELGATAGSVPLVYLRTA